MLVPVSTHVSGSGLTNAFSLMVSDLPVGDMSLTTRIDAVHAATVRARACGQVDLGSMLWHIESVIPPTLLRVLVPPVLRHQPFVNLAVTNLAGSPSPLYLLGSRLLEVYPFITLTGNIGVIVGALSHERRLGVSVTADPQLGLGVERFAHDVAAAADALVRASHARQDQCSSACRSRSSATSSRSAATRSHSSRTGPRSPTALDCEGTLPPARQRPGKRRG